MTTVESVSAQNETAQRAFSLTFSSNQRDAGYQLADAGRPLGAA